MTSDRTFLSVLFLEFLTQSIKPLGALVTRMYWWFSKVSNQRLTVLSLTPNLSDISDSFIGLFPRTMPQTVPSSSLSAVVELTHQGKAISRCLFFCNVLARVFRSISEKGNCLRVSAHPLKLLSIPHDFNKGSIYSLARAILGKEFDALIENKSDPVEGENNTPPD